MRDAQFHNDVSLPSMHEPASENPFTRVKVLAEARKREMMTLNSKTQKLQAMCANNKQSRPLKQFIQIQE